MFKNRVSGIGFRVSIIFFALVICGVARGAVTDLNVTTGTCALTVERLDAFGRDSNYVALRFDCTSTAAGAVEATTVEKFHGEVMCVITNPGATAPTDNYDLVLNDEDGSDALMTAGANRDTANTERAVVTAKSCVASQLTLIGSAMGSAKVTSVVVILKIG